MAPNEPIGDGVPGEATEGVVPTVSVFAEVSADKSAGAVVGAPDVVGSDMLLLFSLLKALTAMGAALGC